MRANAALHTALYTNDKVAHAVLNGVVPNGQHKVESAARMSVLLLTQINKQLQFVKDAPQIVMPFMQDVVEQVLDLTQQVKKIQWSQQEAHAVLGTAQELIMRICGVHKKQMGALKGVLPRSQLMDALDKYHQHLQFIKGHAGAAAAQGGPQPSPGDQAPSDGGQPANGASPQAGGAGASPDSGQPQAGAPVTAAPGPGQSAPPGGMLTQAAAQPPQGA